MANASELAAISVISAGSQARNSAEIEERESGWPNEAPLLQSIIDNSG